MDTFTTTKNNPKSPPNRQIRPQTPINQTTSQIARTIRTISPIITIHTSVTPLIWTMHNKAKDGATRQGSQTHLIQQSGNAENHKPSVRM